MRRDLERRAAPWRTDHEGRVAVTLNDVARRIGELLAALDRRVPRGERATEAAIAKDTAALREKAVSRLAEIEDQAPAAPDDDRR